MKLAEMRAFVYAECKMPVFWKAFSGAVVGKIFITILLAACLALGFGRPDEWVAFMITEAPAMNIPGIARLVLILIGCAGIYIQWHSAVREKVRDWPVARRSLTRGAFVIACCIPFILGAFIVTAKYNTNVPTAEINDLRNNLKTAQSKMAQQEEELN